MVSGHKKKGFVEKHYCATKSVLYYESHIGRAYLSEQTRLPDRLTED